METLSNEFSVYGALLESVEVPLKDSEEVIEITFDQTTDWDEVIEILKQEHSSLKIWFELAKQCLLRKMDDAFVTILTNAREHGDISYSDSEKDRMRVLDSLAGYYVTLARKEKKKDKRRELLKKATELFSAADKIVMFDQNHLLGRAYLCLLEPGKIDQANAQFDFVLEQNPKNIPAILGKAQIFYRSKDYNSSLNFYRQALRIDTVGCASIRLGIGICFHQLKKFELAQTAFERALELDPNCVGALLGLAILKLSTHEQDEVRHAMGLLSTAYNFDQSHPMVLNHLAHHFFYKQDFKKALLLSQTAFENSESEELKSESSYIIAKCYHAMGDFEHAYLNYYSSTQHSSSNMFPLPWLGLGKIHIHRGDLPNAIKCFEKTNELLPQSKEIMKILSILYMVQRTESKFEDCFKFLKQVADDVDWNDDYEVFVALSECSEKSNQKDSLTYLSKAFEMLVEHSEKPMHPELLNNLGCLHLLLNNLDQSKIQFEEALKAISDQSLSYVNDEIRERMQSIINYNIGRVLELRCEYEQAETLYKEILQNNRHFIDCYLRLGCMSRDLGYIFNASDWFTIALSIDQDNLDAWCLMGLLHLTKNELGHAQKKFEKVVSSLSSNNEISKKELAEDSYALLCLGNIWLSSLHTPSRDIERLKRHGKRACSIFSGILRKCPKNIIAANGIGCVLAHKGHIREARDVFSQVREATADFPDVWLNLAHVYVEQKQYISAIQMYENYQKKFLNNMPDTTLWMYIARAHFRAGSFLESKKLLIKVRHVNPSNNLVLFNFCYVLKCIAKEVFRNDNSSKDQVLTAVSDLEYSRSVFHVLQGITDNTKFNPQWAITEEGACSDLLSQSQFFVNRATLREEKEMEKRKQHAEDLFKLQKQQEEIDTKTKIEEKVAQDLLEQKRQEYLKSVQSSLLQSLETREDNEEDFATRPSKRLPKKRKHKSIRANDEKSESNESSDDANLDDDEDRHTPTDSSAKRLRIPPSEEPDSSNQFLSVLLPEISDDDDE